MSLIFHHIPKFNHWFSCWQSILPSYIFKRSSLRLISKPVSWVGCLHGHMKKVGTSNMHSLTFFALLHCLYFNYALLSELIGSLAKAIRSGGEKPDSDVFLDVYTVVHLADLSASLETLLSWACEGPVRDPLRYSNDLEIKYSHLNFRDISLQLFEVDQFSSLINWWINTRLAERQ